MYAHVCSHYFDRVGTLVTREANAPWRELWKTLDVSVSSTSSPDLSFLHISSGIGTSFSKNDQDLENGHRNRPDGICVGKILIFACLTVGHWREYTQLSTCDFVFLSVYVCSLAL